MIEPIPIDELSPRSSEIIVGGTEEGLYATPVPLQIFAYRSALLESMHAKRLARGEGSLLGGRILELLRIRERAARRVPALHAVAQARLHHR